MAKVQAEFELNITGNIKKSLEEIGLSSNKIEQILKSLNKRTKEGFAETASQAEKLRSQLILNEKAYNALTKEEQKNSDIAKKLTQQRDQIINAIKNESSSIKELKIATSALVAERERLNLKASDGVKRFNDLTAVIKKNEKTLKEFDAQIGRNQRNVGNYADAIKGGLNALGIVGGATGAVLATKALIDANAKLSDSFANVRKTTGLTADEIANLDKELLKLDTRTSREALLGIAEGAGRIGIAKDELLGFVEVVDKVVVALGDNLGGSADEIATQMGRLADVFGLSKEQGVAGAINSVGSVINELDNNTKATAPAIVDFTQRLQGVANVAGIAFEDIAGLGAGFSAVGADIEPAATAISQLIIKINQNFGKFAESAGVGEKALREAFSKNTVEGLLFLSKNLSGNGKTIEQFAKSLDGLGLEGQKVVSALGLMGKNTDIFRDSIKIANDEMARGTSLTNEFEIKNNNLAARIEKLKKIFKEFATSPEMIEFLSNLTTLATYAAKSLNLVAVGVNTITTEINKQINLLKIAKDFYFGGNKKGKPEKIISTAEINLNNQLLARTQPKKQEVQEVKQDINKKEVENERKKSEDIIKIKQEEEQAKLNLIYDTQAQEEKSRQDVFSQLQADLDKEAEKIAEMNEQELNDYIKIQEQKQAETEDLRDKYLIDEQSKLQEQANLERLAVIQSKLSEEEKYNAIIEINKRLNKDLSDLDKERIEEKEKTTEILKFLEQSATDFIADMSEALTTNIIENNDKQREEINKKAEEDRIKNEEAYNLNLAKLQESYANQEISLEEFNKRKLEIDSDYNSKKSEIELSAKNALREEEIRFEEEKAKRIKDITKKLLIDTLNMLMKQAIAKVSVESFFDFGTSLLKIAPILALIGGAKAAISAFAGGGLLPNKRNIVLTNDGKGSNFQEFVVNGDRTKKYTKELQIINSGSEQQVQSLFSGAGVKGSVPNLGGTALASGGLAVGSISSNSDILKGLESLSQTIAITNGRVELAINRSNISDKLKIADNREVLLMTKRGQNQLNEVR